MESVKNSPAMRLFNGISLAIALLFLALLSNAQSKQKPVSISSPDGKVRIQLEAGASLTMEVWFKSKLMAKVENAGLEIAELPTAYKNPVFKTITLTPYKQTIKPVLPEKRDLIPDEYTEALIWFKGGYGIRMRAYNDGVAWRFATRLPDSITVRNESFELQMNTADSVYFGEEDNFISHSERQYPYLGVTSIADSKMCVLPAVFRKQDGSLLAFTESDLLDYPGLYLKKKGQGSITFEPVLPQAPSGHSISEDKRSYIVNGRHDYLARTTGTREFPWRVLGLAAEDKSLLENDIVYRLASPCKLKDTDWIKPGKVAWDWWNDWNCSGVPFKAGINTETYKYYIDFASKNGLEYVILDEGWSANDDLEKINPDMDMDQLFIYAKQKNVRLILWVTGKALEDKFESSFNRFEKWGVAGIKVDFLIRDDQEMVNYYEKVAAEAAKRHMLVDYHGSYKPTGLSRTYPNALTREGVQGSENNKWSSLITPTHDCTIPFTRMFAGPMDYTPGAMSNVTKISFASRWSEPMSMGTRCHELAKYVLFDSPLQMLCDNPSNYMKEPESMIFLSAVPSTWNETHALNASIGHYLSMARRNGDTWFIGSMTDWNPRDLVLKLDFLPEGNYTLEYWSDGPNAERKGEDYTHASMTVSRNMELKLHLAPGGGYAAILRKQ
ncbi:MAG: glycoside hydrolase family 97 catalytic domain-containing protein [Bacteroidales bacterium]|nr:glycoside hydrolase family 97 catalytic domain-containing protein [Bacteroidales bacterium]